MPTYRSIVVTLHSQFNVELLPEYPPRAQEYYTKRGITSKVPPQFDEKRSICSVYIPVFPGSQFWIGYCVRPPVPEDQQFLFKLFVNGAHIVSWSTGKDEGWTGKTMFGLYERDDENGKKRVEKRMLCFTPPDDEYGKEWTDVTDVFDDEAVMEIKVHRAHGRKRIERQIEEYEGTEHGKCPRGINLVNGGRAGTEQPKRFYKFALIDPTNQPFATFRYYYRTWDQLRELGLVEVEGGGSSDAASDMSIIEPSDVLDRGGTEAVGTGTGHPASPLLAYVPKGAPDTLESEGYAPRRHHGDSTCSTPSQLYKSNRLSVPPSLKLEPPKIRPLPSIPQKNDPPMQTSYQPHPVYPMDDWIARTPSPVKSIREGISTPPLTKRKPSIAMSLMNAIATTWQRRGTPTPEPSADDDGNGTASRNASRTASRTASRNASRNASGGH